jgi:hypothetical protein
MKTWQIVVTAPRTRSCSCCRLLAERAGALDGRFGCAIPAEALDAHRIFDAAPRSDGTGRRAPV